MEKCSSFAKRGWTFKDEIQKIQRLWWSDPRQVNVWPTAISYETSVVSGSSMAGKRKVRVIPLEYFACQTWRTSRPGMFCFKSVQWLNSLLNKRGTLTNSSVTLCYRYYIISISLQTHKKILGKYNRENSSIFTKRSLTLKNVIQKNTTMWASIRDRSMNDPLHRPTTWDKHRARA